MNLIVYPAGAVRCKAYCSTSSKVYDHYCRGCYAVHSMLSCSLLLFIKAACGDNSSKGLLRLHKYAVGGC